MLQLTPLCRLLAPELKPARGPWVISRHRLVQTCSPRSATSLPPSPPAPPPCPPHRVGPGQASSPGRLHGASPLCCQPSHHDTCFPPILPPPPRVGLQGCTGSQLPTRSLPDGRRVLYPDSACLPPVTGPWLRTHPRWAVLRSPGGQGTLGSAVSSA